MQAELTILGCGDSAGTPRIGNNWGKCDPAEPKNMRTRPSICVRSEGTTLVVDTGPDFRNQINRENIESVSAILYTHAHGDHVNGMDDLRPWFDRTKVQIPIYLMQETLDDLMFRFNYIFKQKSPLYPPIVETHVWNENQYGVSQQIGDIFFIPFLQDHGFQKTLGFRFGDTAYSTDVIRLDKAAIDTLKGIKTWVVDGANLNWDTPVVHMNLQTILNINEMIGAEKIYLTHLKNDLDYKTMVDSLPPNIEPAYDGLKLKVKY